MDNSIAMMSVSTLLLGYYHGLLLRDIDVDRLTDVMCSSGLLTTDDIVLLSANHSTHQKKCMLLAIARLTNDGSLLNFCQAVKEVCPRIGSQMKEGIVSPCIL